MAGNLFDVFVVGATDPSTAGETRLAAALSAKHGVPLATVAKAISAKNLRAGQSLDQAQAQALVRHLQSIGAVTVIRPVTAKPGGQPSTPTARATGSLPTAGPPAMPGGPRASVAMPTAGGGWPGGPSPLPPPPAAPGSVGPAGVPHRRHRGNRIPSSPIARCRRCSVLPPDSITQRRRPRLALAGLPPRGWPSSLRPDPSSSWRVPIAAPRRTSCPLRAAAPGFRPGRCARWA